MEAGAIPPLKPLETDPTCQHLGAPYVAVGVPYHSYDNPTTNIPACLRVGLPPLGGGVTLV